MHYGPRRGIIDCAIVEDFSTVLQIGDQEYGRYISNLYLERTGQFGELKIKDFDVAKYVEDLTDFFKINLLT